MVNDDELVKSWEKTEGQLKEAKRFLDENKIDEALYFVWIAAENLVNLLKTTINGIYLKDHKGKTYILKDYFVLGVLKNDYSWTFEKLSKYRIAAGFHPYTAIPKDYTGKDVLVFLNDIERLRAEIGGILAKAGVLR